MKTLALAALAAATAFASPALADSVCTVDQANDVIAAIGAHSGEVPVLKMTAAGEFPAVLLASPKGEFTLLVLTTDGRACVLAIGHGMAVAPADYRLPAQTTE